MSNIYYDNQETIKQKAEDKLREIISDYVSLQPSDKKSYIGKCPRCRAEKRLLVTPSKNIFACLAGCGFKGKGGLSFLMNLGQSFPEALENTSRILNITVIDKTPVKQTKKKKKNKIPYLDRFLAESGLTKKDVQAKVFHKDENHTTTISQVYKSNDNEDVIIEYYDLEGSPVMYELLNEKDKPTGKFKHYTRIRHQFPEEHLGKDKKPIKYRSPRNSGTHLYIPQRIRELYAKGAQIDRIFIQEGEKKAEKSCKHGILSVGISGIQNLGSKGQVPADLVKLIEKCGIREIVLLFDSDWNDISSNIKFNEDVQKRPRNFFYAAKNYRDYITQLKNRDLYLEIYIGHVKKNEKHDKGIDDLLTNTLKDKENLLQEDIDTLINEKDLTGDYIQLFKVTKMSELKMAELWHLDNPQKFAEHHKEILQNLPEFKIGHHSWTFNDEGELVSVQPIEPDEEYWTEELVEVKGKLKSKYEFAYVNSITFLQNRGFGRLRRMSDGDTPSFYFIKINNPIVQVVDYHMIADYVYDFTKSFVKKAVLEMLYRGGSQYLGPDRLSRLAYIYPDFEKPTRDQQYFYFEKTCWKITKDKINEVDYSQIQHHIWSDQIRDFQPKRLSEPLITVTKLQTNDDTVHFDYQLSEAGKKCQFLQFLINTSNFTWKKEKQGIPILPEEINDNKHHLISKLCAIGFLAMSAKDRSVAKAVIAMDGKQSEVGKSNGRSGKSLVGEMMKYIVPTAYIPGKTDMEKDQFYWNNVDEKTKMVFIDDVKTNFSIEPVFPNITGDWPVNYKGGKKILIPFEMSPKLYITTNHAMNGEGGSFSDRQWLIAFSDFYNDKHKPQHDFNCQFFTEWDYEQWNLLWNMLADCIQLYISYGVVEAPGELLHLRKLRQTMGEDFRIWAEEYFASNVHLNQRIARSEMYEKCLEKLAIKDKKYLTAANFKTRLTAFCEWKGYVLNPNMYDPITRQARKYNTKTGEPIISYKTGGIEYFVVGPWKDWAQNTSFQDDDDEDSYTPNNNFLI